MPSVLRWSSYDIYLKNSHDCQILCSESVPLGTNSRFALFPIRHCFSTFSFHNTAILFKINEFVKNSIQRLPNFSTFYSPIFNLFENFSRRFPLTVHHFIHSFNFELPAFFDSFHFFNLFVRLYISKNKDVYAKKKKKVFVLRSIKLSSLNPTTCVDLVHTIQNNFYLPMIKLFQFQPTFLINYSTKTALTVRN